GTRFTKKVADEGQISLAMWVSGRNPDGTFDNADVRAKYEDNLATLKRLMWKERELVTLTKRFYREGEIVKASAKVEYSRGLEPSMDTPGLARFTVTFDMPDPFFYGEEVEEELPSGTTNIVVEG